MSPPKPPPHSFDSTLTSAAGTDDNEPWPEWHLEPKPRPPLDLPDWPPF